MQTLSAHTILQLWEVGQFQHPQERVITLLAAALPEATRSTLLSLSIGQRDAYLLMLRESTFGSRFEGYAECSRCQERIECAFTVSEVWAGTVPLESIGQAQQLQLGDYSISLCLPTQADMLAMATLRTIVAARQYLLQQCIREVTHEGNQVAILSLPEEVIHALGEQITTHDPQAEVLLTLACPACEQTWSLCFDIASWLWNEITYHAKRLLREVHMLARTYGWSEAAILAMSALRRQYYLEMVSQ